MEEAVIEVTTDQRIRYAILCAMEVCTDPIWRKWADAWITRIDRTEAAAAKAAAWAAKDIKALNLVKIADRAIAEEPPRA